MGFWDRFKKKQEEPKVEEKRQPLTLQYSDGTVAEITFDGTCDVEGKILHAARVVYTDKDGSFATRSLLLEPITSQGENGQWVDSTEQYYRWMAERDGTKEASARYGAVKGFFKKQEITEQKMGSNYIGNVAQREDGQYFRHFDEGFRRQHTARCESERQTRESAKQQSADAFTQNLREQVYDKPVNIKTSHAEVLTPEKNPYTNR